VTDQTNDIAYRLVLMQRVISTNMADDVTRFLCGRCAESCYFFLVYNRMLHLLTANVFHIGFIRILLLLSGKLRVRMHYKVRQSICVNTWRICSRLKQSHKREDIND